MEALHGIKLKKGFTYGHKVDWMTHEVVEAGCLRKAVEVCRSVEDEC
jgi:hypothetical protein